jgi:F0F1-type ATP synthase assembly protein I
LAFQLVATILIFVYLGRYIDQQLGNTTPWMTLLFAIIAVVGSMYRLIKGLTKKQE